MFGLTFPFVEPKKTTKNKTQTKTRGKTKSLHNLHLKNWWLGDDILFPFGKAFWEIFGGYFIIITL